jgi:hypothetical protein
MDKLFWTQEVKEEVQILRIHQKVLAVDQKNLIVKNQQKQLKI